MARAAKAVPTRACGVASGHGAQPARATGPSTSLIDNRFHEPLYCGRRGLHGDAAAVRAYRIRRHRTDRGKT